MFRLFSFSLPVNYYSLQIRGSVLLQVSYFSTEVSNLLKAKAISEDRASLMRSVDLTAYRSRPFVILDPMDPSQFLYLTPAQYTKIVTTQLSNESTITVVARPGEYEVIERIKADKASPLSGSISWSEVKPSEESDQLFGVLLPEDSLEIFEFGQSLDPLFFTSYKPSRFDPKLATLVENLSIVLLGVALLIIILPYS